MARSLRVEFEGAIYHVTCRMLGDLTSRLFKDDKDRERFLVKLSERVEQYNIRLYMFVLMSNHFHLVFETPEGNCSKFMQSLSTAYTVYYNLRHQRHGHLFDGRYKAKVVEGDEYLLNLSRYVHLNPVKVARRKNKPLEKKRCFLREYLWSSYQGYIGIRKRLDWVEYKPILAEIGGKVKERSRRYRRYVETGLMTEDAEFQEALKESPRSIGGDSFRTKVDEIYQHLAAKQDVPEDIAFRRTTEPIDPEEVLEVIAGTLGVAIEEFRQRRRGGCLRGIASRCLLKYSGLTQREAARFLNMGSGAAVSQQIKNLSDRLPRDSKLTKLMKKLERCLSEHRKNIQ